MEDNDAQLQLKKRARRRLVGAVFFVSVVALLLPMLMDHDPRPPLQDVDIRIPGQDEKPFSPAMVAVPEESAPARQAPAVAASPEAPVLDVAPDARVVETVRNQPLVSPTGKPVAKPAEVRPPAPPKPAEKPVAKPAAKVAEKPAEPKPAPSADEAKRAAAILAGKSPAPAASGEHLILIGAFANPSNVVNLRKKLGELGVKTFTEPLDSPQGKKTRVRAGPFPSREAAEKALAKMQRIGVSGVIAAKP